MSELSASIRFDDGLAVEFAMAAGFISIRVDPGMEDHCYGPYTLRDLRRMIGGILELHAIAGDEQRQALGLLESLVTLAKCDPEHSTAMRRGDSKRMLKPLFEMSADGEWIDDEMGNPIVRVPAREQE